MLVHKQTNSLILKATADTELITSVIPRSRTLDYNGDQVVQVNFGLDEVRVLRNMGINAPSPIRYSYDWPGKFTPFEHQIVTAEFFTLNPRAICLNDMGTGKTLSSLWAADYLMKTGGRGKCIIVSPLSTMDSVWANEIRMHLMFSRTCAVLHGSRERRFKLLEQDVDFYIINHDGLKIIAGELRHRTDINLWIFDEAAVYRNAQTTRFKVTQSSVKPDDWAWLMTGTPCPTGPTDAWGLAKLMGNKSIPKYFNAFKSATMEQISPYKWVPKRGAYDKAYGILQPGIRFKKEDCIDLPPVTFQHRVCALTPAQTKAYKDMHHELVAQVGGSQITAKNAAIKLSKLLQICCGVAYYEGGNVAQVDAATRLALVEEVCEEAANKVLVFVPFTAALRVVAAHLSKRWAVEVVDGSTSSTARKRIFDDFQNTDDPRILVAHPKTTAHGLTLTRADTTIWYAPIFSLEIFDQANNRMNRPGQKHPMSVVTIEATPMEAAIYAALRGKGRMQDSVLDLYKKEVGLT